MVVRVVVRVGVFVGCGEGGVEGRGGRIRTRLISRFEICPCEHN